MIEMPLLQRPIFTCLMCTVHRHALCSRDDKKQTSFGGFTTPDCTCPDLSHAKEQ